MSIAYVGIKVIFKMKVWTDIESEVQWVKNSTWLSHHLARSPNLERRQSNQKLKEQRIISN